MDCNGPLIYLYGKTWASSSRARNAVSQRVATSISGLIAQTDTRGKIVSTNFRYGAPLSRAGAGCG
jgi:hypothetical protein